MNILYVTGTDSKYFLMTGILIQAFKRYCPNHKIMVCDFGLDKSHSILLSKSGILLPRPENLKDKQHPWIYKASLYYYIKHLSPDFVVWIDSDCFPVVPIVNEVEDIVSHWDTILEKVAICQGKKGKIWGLASPVENIKYFKIPLEYPYYNSGVWILRSQNVLEQWPEVIERAPKTGMFEQDVFNYLLYKNNVAVQKLDNSIWNVTHDSLNNLDIDSDGRVILDNKRVFIIHITGEFNSLRVTAGKFQGIIRTFENKKLRSFQIQLLKEWVNSIST